jgi:hypothetical protein
MIKKGLAWSPNKCMSTVESEIYVCECVAWAEQMKQLLASYKQSLATTTQFAKTLWKLKKLQKRDTLLLRQPLMNSGYEQK